MSMRRLAALAASCFALALALTACGGEGATGGGGGGGGGAGAEEEGGLVGIAMPTKSSERWIKDGDAVKAELEGLGYDVDLQYAENDIPTQVSQIENMITKGARLLIIAAIDGTTLTEVLQQAADNEIPVIAYDRLIRESENVDYYTTFDNYNVGVLQAKSLLTGLGVLDAEGNDTGQTGPFNIEVFAGSPDDNNATFFFNGAMDTLKPYIDKGVLVVKSGETDFQQVAILRWDPGTAQRRMEDLITKAYAGGDRVDGVLSPYDGLSIGILGALKGSGYGTGGQPYPIVTGQDAELPTIKSIIAGEQYSTIFKDTRELGSVTVQMADDVLKGEEPEVNDTETYDNGVKVVPSFLLEPVTVDKTNYQEVVIDSGYYSEDDLS